MSAGHTPEARARHAAANAGPRKGRASRKVSPWNRGPMCDSPNARKSFKRYVDRGQK